MRPYSGNLYLINKKAGNTVKILAVIVTITKLFHNVKETRNRPHNLTIFLTFGLREKNDRSAQKKVLQNTNERS